MGIITGTKNDGNLWFRVIRLQLHMNQKKKKKKVKANVLCSGSVWRREMLRQSEEG